MYCILATLLQVHCSWFLNNADCTIYSYVVDLPVSVIIMSDRWPFFVLCFAFEERSLLSLWVCWEQNCASIPGVIPWAKMGFRGYGLWKTLVNQWRTDWIWEAEDSFCRCCGAKAFNVSWCCRIETSACCEVIRPDSSWNRVNNSNSHADFFGSEQRCWQARTLHSAMNGHSGCNIL